MKFEITKDDIVALLKAKTWSEWLFIAADRDLLGGKLPFADDVKQHLRGHLSMHKDILRIDRFCSHESPKKTLENMRKTCPLFQRTADSLKMKGDD